MNPFTSTLEALGITLRNLTRKPNTVMHPFVQRVRSDRYRQTFALLHEANGDEACIGCKKCEKICPSEVITVVAAKHESAITGKKRGWAEDFNLDLTACIVCELCVQVCPVDAIVMCSVPTKPSFAREDLLLTMDRLYKNESIPRAPYTGTSLVKSHEPQRESGEAPKA